jgi:hypothetical protein
MILFSDSIERTRLADRAPTIARTPTIKITIAIMTSIYENPLCFEIRQPAAARVVVGVGDGQGSSAVKIR